MKGDSILGYVLGALVVGGVIYLVTKNDVPPMGADESKSQGADGAGVVYEGGATGVSYNRTHYN